LLALIHWENFVTLSKIRLELARDHDFPSGSRERGYEFTAPLADDGRISESEWKTHRDRCRMRRFWSGDADEVGHLIRKPGGSWAFHYDLVAMRTTTKAGTVSAITGLFPANTSRSKSMTTCCGHLK
jgi:hypothetical protein